MRRVLIILFSLICLITLSVTDGHSQTRKKKPPIKRSSEELADSSTSAILIEASTGLVLYEKEPDKPWPPASMTKMMAMLIAAEKMNEGAIQLSDKVKISAYASKMGGSQVWLKEGEEFTFEELMRTVAVASANDSTVSIAEKLAGSVHDFINLMNQRAYQLGLKNTMFHSVHGLPPDSGQKGDITTAADMATLARELVKYPEVLKWSSLQTDEFRGGNLILHNLNKLIGSYQGADGLKTGHFKESGFNFTGTAQRGDLRLIVVIMGAETNAQRFSQAAKLLNFGFSNYTKVIAAKAHTPMGPAIKIKNSKTPSVQAVPGADVPLILKKEEARALIKEFKLPDSVSAPIKKGQELGFLILKTGGKEVAKITLVSPQDVPKAGFLWRLFH